MHEFIEFILSSIEVFGFAIPLLWFAAAGLVVAAVSLRAWATASVVALLAIFPYMVPLLKL
ncbi:MAG: hypothetical protein GY948_22020 [Alphaproteobacteria bacterium]|nr:hypothetical protein [Alphaproteobacteria bacterium]